MKKIFKNRKFYIGLISILLICSIVSLVFVLNNNEQSKFEKYVGNYTPLQNEIGDIEYSPSDRYVNFSDVYTRENDVVTKNGSTTYSGKTLMLYTSSDLYAFSYLCNSAATASEFLAYNYELYSNINYSGETPFIPVGWDNNEFSGTFNGNGFEISNLKLIEIVQTNENIYSNMEYYSMFCINSGDISRVGLVNVSMITNGSQFELTGVAPLVGLNKGNVSYCYVKDLRDAETDDDAGIITSGGYQISGLMFENQGTFNNSYVAYGIICNYSITDYLDFAEILNVNSGSVSNLYFYNSTIDSYSINDGVEVVEYDSFLVGKTLERNQYATYCESIDLINSNLDADSNWYTDSYYENTTNRIKAAFKIETPILRGLEYTVVDNSTQFAINDLFDFLYIYELMNSNSIFASNGCRYLLCCDIDLSYVPGDYYSYDSSFAATFTGAIKDSSEITIKDVLGNTSNYYTIYNAKITNSIINEGVECFGLFPWLTGRVENINIYYGEDISGITYSDSQVARLAVGLVSGIVDGGTIENVNVYGNCSLSTNKQYFVGGISGILTSKGNVLNCTTAGSINGGSSISNYTITEESGYISGNAMGGVVGFSTSSTGNVNTCLNAMALTATTYSSNISYSQNIGGVIGVGYTQNTLNLDSKNINLSNKGNITIGSASNSNYGYIYSAGVIGKLLGISEQINSLYNQGNITIYGSSSLNGHYISGVLNAELLSTSTAYLNSSPLRNNKGKTILLAGGLSNAATFNLNNTNGNLNLSGVINLISNNSSNRFISELSGIYNLEHNYTVSNNSNVKTKLATQELSMNQIYSFAPCLSTTGSNQDNLINVESIYNFRDYEYTTSNNVTNNIKYSGCILGKYINITDARNEGNINYNISNAISNTSFITVGVFEEITSQCMANNIYNSGDIDLDTNVTITSNLYFNGICYANYNGFSASEHSEFNPLSNNYDNSKEGSLNNAINNGNITITNSTGYNNLSYNHEDMLSSNAGQVIGTKYVSVNNAPSNYIIGNINISGITYLNYSVITNTFNLGNMFGVNYITSTSNTYEVNSAGISILNVSEYSYILNSANNGTILACNLSGIYDGDTLSNVSAAGISIRNNRTEANANYDSNNNHSKQLISYTINYGTIIAYDNRENITSSNMAPNSSAAGILSMGLCNILNTVNYGNIYGNETSSGIFGVVYFEDFENEVSLSNNVSLANSINYGNVYLIEKGANYFKDSTSIRPVYSNILDFFNGSFSTFAKAAIPLEYANTTFSGSIFALLNFNGNSNANYVTIRYLINFLDYVPFVGAEAQTPDTVTVDVSNMYSANKTYVNGVYVSDTYLNEYMTYSPLTTGTETISTGTYYGVFNEEFAFRRAIEGAISLDISSYPTDQFLTDYFQFVGYTKINDTLLDKIGWRNIAYSTAAHDYARNLEGLTLFLNKYQTISGNTYSTDISTALNTGTWINYCSSDIVDQLVDNLFAEDLTLADFENIINYVFSNECEESVYITYELRQNIVEYIISNNPEVIVSSGLLTFDNANSYSSVLADVLSSNNDNTVKQHIKAGLDTYISNIEGATTIELLYDYLDFLGAYGTQFFENNSEQARYNLALSFFDNIDDQLFYSALYYSLDEATRNIIDNIESNNLKLYGAYNSFTDEEKLTFYLNILSNNVNNISTYLDTMIDELDLYNELNQKGYAISNFDSYLDSSSITSSATDINTVTERINLYNQIRTTNTFKNYIESKNISTYNSSTSTYSYVAKATELRNTFRSDYAPIPDGERFGDLAYTYATTVTPQTNFFGPYEDANKTLFNNYSIYSPIPTAAPTDSSGGITNANFPVFVSDDMAFMDQQVSDGYIYDYTAYYYEYGSGASNNQFTSRKILGAYNNDGTPYFRGSETDTSKAIGKRYGYKMTDFTGVQVTNLEDVWVIDDDGVEFNARGGIISPYFRQNTTDISGYDIDTSNYSNFNYYGYFYITDINGVVHYFSTITESGRDHSSDHGSLFTNNGTNCTYHGWADFVWKYGKTLYHSYATEKLHPTRYTGLYKHKDGNLWWTNKDESTKLYTSSYIDYSVDDLLNLDGVLSLYDGVTQSSDERNIINDLFNNYFINDTNFESVVKACFLEKLAYSLNQTIDVDYINNFIIANINTDKTINSSAPLIYLTYNNTTVYNYLLSLFTGDSKSNLLHAMANSTTVFKEVLEIICNASSNSLSDEEKEKFLSASLIATQIMNNEVSIDSSGRINISSLDIPTEEELFGATISASSNLTLNYYSSSDSYGITFNSVTFATENTDQAGTTKIVFNASGVSGNTTLTVKDQDDNVITTLNITASNASYEVDVTSSTTITLESSQDVIIYNLDVIRTVSNSTATDTVEQSVSATNVYLYSLDTLTTNLEDLGYTNVEITDVVINFNVTNTNNNSSQYIAILEANYSTATAYVVSPAVSGGGSYDLSYANGMSLLQQSSTTRVYCRRGSTTSSYGSSSRINTVSYTVTFTCNQESTLTSNILPGLVAYNEAYEDIHKYDFIIESAVDGYAQYTNPGGIASDYIFAYLKDNIINEQYTTEFLNSTLLYLMPLDGDTTLISSLQTQLLEDNNLMKLLSAYTSSNLRTVINSINDIDILKIILEDFVIESNNYLLGSIIYSLNSNGKISDDNKKLIVAAYLATDYSKIYEETLVNSDTKVTSTIFYEKLSILASNYQYINSDGSFDNDLFDNFVLYIGYDMTTSGYGIYALASSKGILNGQFIPDNFVLEGMDTNYDYNSSEDYWYLTDTATASWRGGVTDGTAIRTDGSVNKGFLTDMKQLKLSISTTIFELNLVDTDGNILYSSEDLIDFENGSIIYYVPSNYVGRQYQWYSQSIANGAILDKTNISGSNYLSVNSSTTIIVTAEDPTISLAYNIEIVSGDIDFELSSATPNELPASGGNVVVNLSSVGVNLPYGLDITPYISIKKSDVEFDNYSFVNNAIIDENGNAVISILIDSSLPWGQYYIEVSLFNDPNLTKSSSFSKIKSTEAKLIDFEYDGAPQDSMISNYELTTEIKFGRLYSYDELTNCNSADFYLSYLSYSDNADLSISASYEINADLITYEIIYVVTAEDTNYSSTYVHTLVEQNPIDISNYANIYKDGKLDSTANIDSSSKEINISFDRGYSPYYRIKYNLNKVYTDGVNVNYSYVTSNANTSVDASFTGLSINVPDALDAGIYTFNYIYNNQSVWQDDIVYEKNYSFPTVNVTKNYSKDSLLKKITFLENSAALTASTTVMNASYAIKSNEDTGSASEPIYYDLRDLTSNYREINVTSKNINYSNMGTDYSTSTNFFTVGSVSNATLSDYAPVFSIEDHAQMYQYTTLAKMQSYGYGIQTLSDTEALTTDYEDVLYLYVPFEDSLGNIRIFMIEVINGIWGSIYTDSFVSINLEYDSTTKSFSYEGVTYTLSDKAGTIKDNSSLYMDYIGTPLDNHFWYVSYVIFSEDYLMNPNSNNSNLKFYHVAIIDATNTIYLDLTFDTSNATNFNMDSFYLNITDRIYKTVDDVTTISTSYVSAFVTYEAEADLYSLDNQLQVLPHGYFYFTLDLPDGYICEYEVTSTNKANQNSNSSENGAYLPPSSIITQRISITIYIKDGEVGQTWGEATSDVYGRLATEINN